MFFELTQKYAGIFAIESEQTISGSISMLKAALSSFTAGLGNANADMTNLTRNLVDAFGAVVQNIVPVLGNIVTALPPAANAILSTIGDMLPSLIDTVTGLFEQVLVTCSTFCRAHARGCPGSNDHHRRSQKTFLIIDAAVQLIKSLAQGLTAALPQLIPAALSAIMTIVRAC